MTTLMSSGSFALLAMMLSGCEAARIATPADLAPGTEILELRGLGYGRSGSFQFAGGHGDFTRGADRWSVGAFQRSQGGARFQYIAAAGLPDLSGTCAYAEDAVNLGVATATTRPFAYRCRLGRGGVEAGELVIRDGGAAFRDERAGFLTLNGVRLEIRSIHRMAGGGLPTSTPLGYRFEDKGRAVGAVDLNGNTKIVHAPPAGGQREAVFAGSLALSTLWDPATL